MNIFGTTGQQRRAWLNDKADGAYNALDYYLGPTGIPDKLRAVAELAHFTDAGDVYEAADASRDLWNDPSIANAARYAAAGAATAIPFVGARMINEGTDILGSAVDDFMTGYDPARVNMGVSLNSKPMYHGTPDVRPIREAGGFQPRTQSVAVISDPDKWDELGARLAEVEHGSDEYFRLLDERGAARGYREIPSPLFLSPDRPLAASYADDARAFDFQNAEPAVVEAMTDPQNVLDINAGGATFRGINQERVKKALTAAGVPEADIGRAMRQLAFTRDGHMSTDDLAIVANDLGFDAVDVANVVDTYNATGRPGTVRMMLDPSKATVPAFQSNADQINPATTRGQQVLDMLAAGRGSEVTDDMLDMGDPVLNARLNEYLWNNYDLPMDEASRMARAEGMGFVNDTLYHSTPHDFSQFDLRASGMNTTIGDQERAVFMSDRPEGAESFVSRGYVADFQPFDGMETLDDARARWQQVREAEGEKAADQWWRDFVQPNAPVSLDYSPDAKTLPLRVNMPNGFDDWQFGGAGYNPDLAERSILDAKKGGADAVLWRNVVDGGYMGGHKKQNVLAHFDPANIRSRFARFDPRLAHLRNLSAGLAGGLLFGGMALTPSEEAEIEAYLGGI